MARVDNKLQRDNAQGWSMKDGLWLAGKLHSFLNHRMIIIHTTNELPPQRHRVHRERTETNKKKY